MSARGVLLSVVFLTVSLALFGCGGPQVKVEPIAVTENPTEQVNMLNTEIGNARKDHINVLAPISFTKAEENLKEASEGLGRGDEITGILEQVAQGRAQLKRATENARVAQTALADVIKARDDARAAGATTFEQDYADVEDEFLELTRSIEKDDLKWAQRNQAKVIEKFRSLEVRAIKDKTLGEVRDTIAQAEKEGAKKFAPELLAEATNELNEVDTFISENPYKKEEMLQKAANALFDAQRLIEITRQSAALKEMKPVDTALMVEGMLGQVTGKLSAPDMRNQPFETQVANIVGTIGALQSDRQFLDDKVKEQQAEMEALKKKFAADMEALKDKYNAVIVELEGKTKEEQEAIQRLEAEKRANEERLAAEKLALEAEKKFNQLYTEVQTYFDADEAEVYKQGRKLVIRLRTVKFPVGKAIIMPENYSLLTKVQKAIRTFGEPTVVVEGHTDSTGSAATNELLSQHRAEAVREYFVANQTLPAEKVTAIGYGPDRPLASNATEEGRAINRRIDVVITPGLQPGT